MNDTDDLEEHARWLREECHGIDSLHPMRVEEHPYDPFDAFTKIAAVLAGLCFLGMLLAPLFR